jgi:BolA protein
MNRIARIRTALEADLAPIALDVVDESHKHVGHAGARDGRGHFALSVVSPAFIGLSLLARHRRVYAAVGDLMQSDIHALSIQAFAPGEAGAEEVPA